ncbi:MAG: YbaB/EbfC family nucleoid-associated protein [Sulfurovum sp.]|nr:YbaB/EbfC family nucleoid-associated protein [Sulfurovum sp.]MDD3601954.1 YbaB/EbfC family nucleoid-associated protein [Sulfurovum sp.]
MFEGLDLGNMGKMLEQMQEKAKALQEEAKHVELTAKSGGGLVAVKANGAGEIIDVEIDDSLLEDKESLQILLISAINDVIKMVEDNKKSQALGMMGGLNPFGFSK